MNLKYLAVTGGQVDTRCSGRSVTNTLLSASTRSESKGSSALTTPKRPVPTIKGQLVSNRPTFIGCLARGCRSGPAGLCATSMTIRKLNLKRANLSRRITGYAY